MSNCFYRLFFGLCKHSKECDSFDKTQVTCSNGPQRYCGKFRRLEAANGA
jgi:hypothetical protein